jgi:biopolymer transport protein TolR
MRPRRLKNEINVVPYIDVMLVLLVIFMVTAPMMTTASIDVPSVGKAAQPPAEALQVIVRADQTLALLAPGKPERALSRANCRRRSSPRSAEPRAGGGHRRRQERQV